MCRSERQAAQGLVEPVSRERGQAVRGLADPSRTHSHRRPLAIRAPNPFSVLPGCSRRAPDARIPGRWKSRTILTSVRVTSVSPTPGRSPRRHGRHSEPAPSPSLHRSLRSARFPRSVRSLRSVRSPRLARSLSLGPPPQQNPQPPASPLPRLSRHLVPLNDPAPLNGLLLLNDPAPLNDLVPLSSPG